jgi:SAM-dependent methyltransferase
LPTPVYYVLSLPEGGAMTERRHHERLMFDKVPEIYDRVRPSYPPALFDKAFRYLRERVEVAEPQVVEIGPGTGQATRSLLERGARVTAVEIGASLSAFLRRKFAGESRLEVISAPFEVARLESGAYDLVFSATAFHWIDPAGRRQPRPTGRRRRAGRIRRDALERPVQRRDAAALSLGPDLHNRDLRGPDALVLGNAGHA